MDEGRGLTRRAGLVAAAATMLAAGAARAEGAGPIVELRQYKIFSDRRDAFTTLFEREFVDSQEALGMRLVGQFHDLDDPSRFVWIRQFDDMAQRQRALTAFYSGPIWQAHRGEANPMLEDNDNVLLLHPQASGRGFGPAAARTTPPAPAGLVIASIWRLWKEPDAGFSAAFDALRPELAVAGLPVLAAFAPERSANTFPALPVREGEKVFVWFSRVADARAYDKAAAALARRAAWTSFAAERLESRPQMLRLAPTPRSALR